MKYPVIERKYMRWMLTIKVWYGQPSMKCKVEYWLWSIDLPRHIDELWSWIRWVSDYEDAKRLYKIITMETNDMLREYYLKHNQSENLINDGMMAEQFRFQPMPTTDTVINVWAFQITAWATPTELTWNAPSREELLRVERYEPRAEYLSDEEYEEKKRNWELRSWCVYCVLN